MTKPLVFNYAHYERLRDYANDLLLDNQQLMEDNRKLRKEVEELKQLNDGYVKIIAKNQETNNKLMASVQKQTGGDLISRADAIEAVRGLSVLVDDKDFPYFESALLALPSADAEESYLNAFYDGFNTATEALSADAEPTVIRAKTFMRKEDFDKWAEDIKKQSKSIVCIPCDAEVVSADAVHGWRIGKPTEQGEYMVTLDSFGHKHIDLFYYGKPLMPNRKVRGKCWYRSDDEWGDVVYDDTDILAWQPLPKPYKGGDTE